ncbi:hypothetical protein GCM10010347_19800 [Streptomyces cirratus]|uniref:Uncharacterized protein n=1 Tax=Streptomyces cirratus TaxID=68187 RepID=A0ABQ3EPQ6_9ACTN|nr:hypothetical protein GCM10010347_19800 [Streptomyces cirratus]
MAGGEASATRSATPDAAGASVPLWRWPRPTGGSTHLYAAGRDRVHQWSQDHPSLPLIPRAGGRLTDTEPDGRPWRPLEHLPSPDTPSVPGGPDRSVGAATGLHGAGMRGQTDATFWKEQ